MACPRCGCKLVYEFDDEDDLQDYRMQRCAACGEVFDLDEHAEEGDDDLGPVEGAACGHCHGDGMDPWNDYLLPCPVCAGD